MSNSYFKGLGLTDQQVDAVRCEPGPVMVVAGAGSGKTSVIAHRFIYLHKHFGIEPERILCVTFTNKAVNNMRDRIMKSLSYEDYQRFQGNVHVMTFHALCKEILLSISERRSGGNMKKFAHLSKCMPVIKEILQDYPHIKAAYAVSVLLSKLRWLCKSQDRDFTEDDFVDIGVRFTVISDAEALLKKFPYQDIKAIYHRFDEELEKRQWMTLDDIILDTKKYLMDKEIMDEWCAKFDAILCDEFQDVDAVQFEILTKLCEDDNNLFCVGDPDQAIYGFRGAMPNIFSKLKEHFSNRGLEVQVKKLEKNFRSTPEILKVANQLINSGNTSSEFRKDLFTDNGSGEVPMLDILESPKDQALHVVERVEELRAQGVELSKIMVLGRNQSHYKHIKNAFLHSSIHYEDWKEVFSLVRHAEVKDLIHWISVGFVKDDPARWCNFFHRVFMRPSLGVGPVTFLKMMSDGCEHFMEKMERLSLTSSKVAMLMRKVRDIQSVAADPDLSVYEKCHAIAKKSGIIDFYRKKYGDDSYRIDAIQKFLDSPMILTSDSWDEALSHVEKYLSDNSKDRLIFSTIHGVKGLECDHVFVVSLSEGNLPSKRGLKICKNQQQIDSYIEEERRLLYVACTRAKKTLNFFVDTPEVSQFIHDMEGTFGRGIMKTAPVNILEEEDSGIENVNFDLDEV